MKKIIIFVFVLLLGFSVVNPLKAEKVSSREKISGQTTLQDNLQFLKEYKDSLHEERQLLESQSERHFQHLDNLLKWFAWILGALGAIAIGIFRWQFGATRNELKASVQEMFQSRIKEIVDTVEKDAVVIRQQWQELSSQVGAITSYQKRQITWVFENNEISAQQEFETLNYLGLKNINL